MPRISQQRTDSRKEEIIQACAALYETKGFKEITLKDIGAATTLTRTGIYLYFETKEEIFLALLAREYDTWVSSLQVFIEQKEQLTRLEVAKVLAATLTKHPRLLRLLSMNLYEMEANSRLENLIQFKHSFKASLASVDLLLKRHIPEMDETQRMEFIYAFFPFIYGIYPYTSVTEKQKNAMREAGIPYRYMSAYDLTLSCLKKLLSGEPVQ